MGDTQQGRNAAAHAFLAFHSGRAMEPPASLLAEVRVAIARDEERRPGALRDQWGNWDARCVQTRTRDEDRRAWLDRRIIEAYGGVRRAPRWGPQGAPMAVALSHDVDVIARHRVPLGTCLEGIRRAVTAGGGAARTTRQLVRWGSKALALPLRRRPDPAWNFEFWLDAEARRGFRSTFFFFPERLERPHPDDCCYRWSDPVAFETRRISVLELMREISDRGWEIGLHASVHAARDGLLLRAQRAAVAEAIGREIESVRFHYLSWDPWITPELVAAAGLRADATIGYNLDSGYRAGTSFPWPLVNPINGEPLPTVEVPFHLMDGALLHPQGREVELESALEVVRAFVSETAAHGGCLGADWHTNHVSLLPYRASYEALLDATADAGAYGASVGRIAEIWREATRSEVENS